MGVVEECLADEEAESYVADDLGNGGEGGFDSV